MYQKLNVNILLFLIFFFFFVRVFAVHGCQKVAITRDHSYASCQPLEDHNYDLVGKNMWAKDPGPVQDALASVLQ